MGFIAHVKGVKSAEIVLHGWLKILRHHRSSGGVAVIPEVGVTAPGILIQKPPDAFVPRLGGGESLNLPEPKWTICGRDVLLCRAMRRHLQVAMDRLGFSSS
jgi:hypothetical protein